MKQDKKKRKKTFLYIFFKYVLHISIEEYQKIQHTHTNTHRVTQGMHLYLFAFWKLLLP